MQVLQENPGGVLVPFAHPRDAGLDVQLRFVHATTPTAFPLQVTDGKPSGYDPRRRPSGGHWSIVQAKELALRPRASAR